MDLRAQLDALPIPILQAPMVGASSLVTAGKCLAVIEGEEGIVSGTAPRETYDFVASYFEG